MALIIFNAVQVPIDISYGMPRRVTSTMDYLNWGMDFLFALDICLNFRTAYFDHQGRLVSCPALILRQGQPFYIFYTITLMPPAVLHPGTAIWQVWGTATRCDVSQACHVLL